MALLVETMTYIPFFIRISSFRFSGQSSKVPKCKSLHIWKTTHSKLMQMVLYELIWWCWPIETSNSWSKGNALGMSFSKYWSEKAFLIIIVVVEMTVFRLLNLFCLNVSLTYMQLKQKNLPSSLGAKYPVAAHGWPRALLYSDGRYVPKYGEAVRHKGR